ncbi:exocyst complex component Sec6-domain-containing protein [Chytridium lagenaria]|nr:exocyst complex component Sec6-domain-containing protein [Chytridium lagenaria]
MNFETEAREAAVFRIQEILKHPDDLVNKLALVRKKLSSERASIDAQLRTAVETQLEEIQHGMDILQFSDQETSHIQKNLSLIDNLWCQPPKTTSTTYQRIKKISRTHQNFVATKLLVEQFQKLNTQISRACKRYCVMIQQIDICWENLLFVHYQLQMLEAFRDNTLRKSRSSTEDVLDTLPFEAYLWLVGGRTMDLVKSGNTGAVIRLVKIIETKNKPMKNLEEVVNEGDDARVVKGYRIKFFDVLREAIGKQVKLMYENNSGDLPKLLQTAELIIDDLILINDELEPRFPRKYNIFQFFVLEYHRSIYDMWVRDYYFSMNGRLGVGEELLEPRLLDDREEELILEYIKLVRQKLSEWLNNLLNSETRDFVERTAPPDSDSNGIYLLSGSVIQVDVVSQSSQCCNAIEEFQKSMFEGAEFSEVIIKRIDSLVDDPFKAQASLKVKRCYGILIEISIKDILPATSRFYCSEWYEQDLMRLVEHMQEYLFSKFTSDLQDRFIVVYGAKLRMPGAVEKMKADLEMALEFFSRFRTAKRVKVAFEVMEKIINFIESNSRMIFLDFYSLWKAYPDVPLSFIEELLTKRDDLDRSQIKEIMEQCKERVLEEREKSTGKETPTTIFSKISFK